MEIWTTALGLDFVSASFRLCRLARGTAGFSILLLLLLLGKAADELTVYLVVSRPVKDRCLFVYSQVNGRLVAVLQNAQILAVDNTCPYDIYKKVNLDSSFCPDESDIIGSWKCETTASLTLPAGTSNVTMINDLRSNKMLYQKWFDEYSGNTATGSKTNQGCVKSAAGICPTKTAAKDTHVKAKVVMDDWYK